MTLLYAIWIGPLVASDPSEDVAPFPYVNLVTQYICAIILHMTMQPKVCDALERLYYIKRHPHKFDRVMIPMVICFFKLIVEVMTEFTSLALTATCLDTKDVVMNYIALGVISELDSVYLKAIRNPLKQQFMNNNQEIPITNFEKVNVAGDLSKIDRSVFFSLKLIKFGYEAIYFHMFPYILFIFIYLNDYFVAKEWNKQF